MSYESPLRAGNRDAHQTQTKRCTDYPFEGGDVLRREAVIENSHWLADQQVKDSVNVPSSGKYLSMQLRPDDGDAVCHQLGQTARA